MGTFWIVTRVVFWCILHLAGWINLLLAKNKALSAHFISSTSVQSDGLIRNKPRICMKGRHNLAFLKSLTKGFCSLDLGQGRNKCWWILFYKRHQQLQYQSLLIMSSQYNQRQDFTQPRGFHYLPIIHTLNRFTMTDGRLPWQLC